MDKLSALIKELESRIPYSDKLNISISQVSVGWHIQHAILTSLQIIKALENSNPQNYKWKFSLSRMVVFSLNKIPRGKGKAPKSVQPSGVFDAVNILNDIQLLKEKVKLLSQLKANHYFEHPYFGSLNLKATIKMLQIHTKHHISIIYDIIKT